MLALAWFADERGWAYPSVSRLAERARMTTRNVNLVLARLKASGELEVRLNAGPKGSNLYRITLPDANTLVAGNPERAFSPEAGFTPEEQFTPEAEFTLKPPTQTPEADFPNPLKPASAERSLKGQERPTRRDAEAMPEGFSRFWSTWPAGTRKTARRQCLAKWRASGCELIADQIVAAVEVFKSSADWIKAEGAYIPAPLVWLNQSRWEAVTTQIADRPKAEAESERTRRLLMEQAAVAARAVPPPAHLFPRRAGVES
jgi:hypothetical protein